MAASIPHPTSIDYANDYSAAWTNDPHRLLEFFNAAGSYTDVAMGTTYSGHEGILRFHQWMLKFSPDSDIRFYDAAAGNGLLYLEWTWSGSITGPLRLPVDKYLDAAGKTFSINGIAACHYSDDGKLISHRDFWDVGLLVAQLGYSLTPTESVAS